MSCHQFHYLHHKHQGDEGAGDQGNAAQNEKSRRKDDVPEQHVRIPISSASDKCLGVRHNFTNLNRTAILLNVLSENSEHVPLRMSATMSEFGLNSSI